jgi:outer membrane receptor for ferrienterochelin and colicin
MFKSFLYVLVLCLLIADPLAVFAQYKGSISGSVVNRNSQEPLRQITLELSPGNIKVLSDSNGNFKFSTINTGTYKLTTTAISYQAKTINNIIITSGNEYTLLIELEPAVKELANVVVSGRKNTAKAATIESPLSVQRLTIEDIKANPGGNFDISKVIQSLPGVGGGAAGGSFRNDIIIRGGAPSENVFYLDGIEVPIINHFSTQGSGGGPQGILNVSFIEDVKLSTSAFDARYDNALSSVFQFKQKNGNSNRLQGNIRLSATELAATFDAPVSKKTTFLASARRSYLQLLFKLIDLPIRPNYWDFQFKTTTKLNKKTTLTTIGIGAIDEFRFAVPKTATPEKLYLINSNPLINQKSYTVGVSIKHLTQKGFWNLSLSRNSLQNSAEKFEDNKTPSPADRTLQITSNETENKLRYDNTINYSNWKLSYGAVLQYVQFSNLFFQLVRPQLTDAQGNIIQQAQNFTSNTGINFLRYGAFVQAGNRFFNNRLAISAGVRIDANSLNNSEANPLQQFSPRLSISYALANQWNVSASLGSYYRLPSYTQLAFVNTASGNNILNPGKYIKSNHLVAGVEYLPSSATRFTIEGFYKQYANYPVSITDKISLANKGIDFGAIGNEPVTQNGKGRAYGIELFAQQKLTNRFFGVFSYTLFWSEFTGLNTAYIPSSWDNRTLLSATVGYKLKRNWELGVKFRYQGRAPYSPFDLIQSQLNYLTLGTGVLNYQNANSQRLPAFNAGDIRIDKKWNLKRTTIDLFLDIQNFYGSKSTGAPFYTFKRNADNTNFITTDNQPIQQNGANAIPVILNNTDGNVLPTIGFIVEF